MGADGTPRYVHADRYEELLARVESLETRTADALERLASELRGSIANLRDDLEGRDIARAEQLAEHHARLCNLGEAVDRVCAVQRDQVRPATWPNDARAIDAGIPWPDPKD